MIENIAFGILLLMGIVGLPFVIMLLSNDLDM